MSDVAETKPDPTTQAPEADKPETATTEKSVTEAAADKAAEVAETAKDAAVKTSDNVFSMFGGGPKKEEKKDDEEENDRSGSAKAQKEDKEEDVEADKVSWKYLEILGWVSWDMWFGDSRCCKTLAKPRTRGGFSGPAACVARCYPAAHAIASHFQ